MKISLQLKLGQQLTMTPQLQQAIRLLQLSTLDLQQEVHQALESNPMLELDESHSSGDDYQASADSADGTAGDLPETQPASSADTPEFDPKDSYDNDHYSATDSVTAGREADSQQAADSYADEPSDVLSDSGWEQSIPEQLSVDTSWDDIYQNSYSTGSPAPDADYDF